MPVPDSVTKLVQRFADNRAQYLQTNFNETQTRIDFVNPFFAALGWDMDNAQGLPEAYRQVVHEDAPKIERTVKAPDYSFRLGGQRKYFLETKKLLVVINLSHRGRCCLLASSPHSPPQWLNDQLRRRWLNIVGYGGL